MGVQLALEALLLVMSPRLCLFFLLASPAAAGWFGPPQFVTEACKKWCDEAADNADANEACEACNGGAQSNPECKEKDCSYCQREIVFPRHYPKLWHDNPDFKVNKLTGKTRCWCETGCPVFYTKSYLFCHQE